MRVAWSLDLLGLQRSPYGTDWNPFGNERIGRFLLYWQSTHWRQGEPGGLAQVVKRRGRGTNLPFPLTSYFSKPMTMQWLMAARKIGKRLASLEPLAISRLSDETHEVICGVAGCVVKRKKLRRITEWSSFATPSTTPSARHKKTRYRSGPGDGGRRRLAPHPLDAVFWRPIWMLLLNLNRSLKWLFQTPHLVGLWVLFSHRIKVWCRWPGDGDYYGF